MVDNKLNGQYETLSPWAEIDPIPLRGISPRIKDLAGKKIGLLKNFKRAAGPMLTVVERELKKRYPTAQFIWYPKEGSSNLWFETETEKKEEYLAWINQIDAAITAVGD
jgi:DUF2075 family protein